MKRERTVLCLCGACSLGETEKQLDALLTSSMCLSSFLRLCSACSLGETEKQLDALSTSPLCPSSFSVCAVQCSLGETEKQLDALLTSPIILSFFLRLCSACSLGETEKQLDALYQKQGRESQFSSRSERNAWLQSNIDSIQGVIQQKTQQVRTPCSLLTVPCSLLPAAWCKAC